MSDARRLCGVISTQLHAPPSLDSYGPTALNRSTDYNVDDELSDDDPSIADSDASSPNVRRRGDTQLRRQDVAPNSPSQHRYLLTLLSITLHSSRDKGSSPASPSTDPNSSPDSHKTARIYFLDVLPARHPPSVGESANAPPPVVSPRALERALHSRAAIRSPFQPWDIKSIAGGGTLLPLLGTCQPCKPLDLPHSLALPDPSGSDAHTHCGPLSGHCLILAAEALCPLSRLVVVAHVDLACPALGPMHVLRLAAKTTQVRRLGKETYIERATTVPLTRVPESLTI